MQLLWQYFPQSNTHGSTQEYTSLNRHANLAENKRKQLGKAEGSIQEKDLETVQKGKRESGTRGIYI